MPPSLSADWPSKFRKRSIFLRSLKKAPLLRFFTKSAETTLEGLERHENVIIRSAKEKERNSRGTDDEDLKKKKKERGSCGLCCC